MICIFCASELKHDTKPEHILLNALGGKKTTKTVICSSCNEQFGRGPDQELADSVREIRNLALLYSGDGDPPPPLKGAKVEGGRYDLLPDGSPVFVPDQPFSVEADATGFSVEIRASNVQHADRLLTNAARKILKKVGHMNYPQAAIDAIKQDLWRKGKRILSKPPSRTGELGLGEISSQQSMAKATLVLWAKHLGAKKLQGQKYDAFRSFCESGVKPKNWDWWVHADARELPHYPSRFGSNPNLVWVGSNWMGQVYGYFRLYNIMGWRFRLCEVGGAPNTSICLISNPFDPSVWEVRTDDHSILSHPWVHAASAENMEFTTDRLAVLGRRGQQVKFERFLANTIKSAFQQRELNDENEPKQEQSEKIANYILSRLRLLVEDACIEEEVARPSN